MKINKFNTISDNEIINWWEDWGLNIPDKECLPKKGYVIINNNIKVAAGYVYYTNSKIAYLDFIISNINYKKKDRNALIITLIDHMVEEALSKGCKLVWATTSNDNMLKKAIKLNYKVLDKKHNIIYKYS
jgi:hypothetical protein|tara:strand:- start:7 stop:396 length:390 start_codon:yes stop_codon:yes gene_type:complete